MVGLPYMNNKDEAFYHLNALGIGKHASSQCSFHKGTPDAEKGIFASPLDPTSDKQSTPSPSLNGVHFPEKHNDASHLPNHCILNTEALGNFQPSYPPAGGCCEALACGATCLHSLQAEAPHAPALHSCIARGTSMSWLPTVTPGEK